MMKWALGTFVLSLLAILTFVLIRTGYFKEVTISSGFKGPYTLAYREHIGPYHKIPPVITSVESFFKNNDRPCLMAFGRYFDNPDEVDHDRLRSQGGCIFPGRPQDTEFFLSSLKAPPSAFKIETDFLEKKEYILATFNGSPSVGPLKVYPKVTEWMDKYGYSIAGPVIEIYKTLPDETVLTTYLFPYK